MNASEFKSPIFVPLEKAAQASTTAALIRIEDGARVTRRELAWIRAVEAERFSLWRCFYLMCPPC